MIFDWASLALNLGSSLYYNSQQRKSERDALRRQQELQEKLRVASNAEEKRALLQELAIGSKQEYLQRISARDAFVQQQIRQPLALQTNTRLESAKLSVKVNAENLTSASTSSGNRLEASQTQALTASTLLSSALYDRIEQLDANIDRSGIFAHKADQAARDFSSISRELRESEKLLRRFEQRGADYMLKDGKMTTRRDVINRRDQAYKDVDDFDSRVDELKELRGGY